MRIYIRQGGNKYKFFENDNEEESFTGFWNRKRKIGLHAKVFDKNNAELVSVVMTNSPPFWRLKDTLYKIEVFQDKIEFELKAIKIIRGHWSFNIKDDIYDYYFHRGHKKSLYRNKSQVAKFDKGTVHLWSNDTGFIVSNNDENKFVLMGLFLAFDMGEEMDGDLNIDFGKVTNGIIDYNPRWYPIK